MKRNFKRWMALLLAVAMVAGTCLTHAEGSLWATDGVDNTDAAAESDITAEGEITGEEGKTSVPGENEPVVTVQEIELPQQEEEIPEEVPVEEEEIPKEVPAEEEKITEKAPAEEEEISKEIPVEEEEIPEEVPAEEEEIPEEVPAEEEEIPEEAPVEEVEKTFHVTFAGPQAGEGTLRVWADGEGKTEASYINAQYVKEVKENTILYFEIEAADGYRVDQVQNQYGNVLSPESVNGNVSTYKAVITEDTWIAAECQIEKKANIGRMRAFSPSVDVRSSTERVYLYTTITGDGKPEDWENNGIGRGIWYTIGYVEVEGIDSPVGKSSGTKGTEADMQKVLAAINDKNGITYKNNYAKQFFGKIKWGSMMDVGQGATDYPDTGYGSTWHLNGELDLTDISDNQNPEKVYLYTEIIPGKRMPAKWVNNGNQSQKWFTIGYVEVTGIPSATEAGISVTDEYRESVRKAIQSNSIEYASVYAETFFPDIAWKDMSIADGAPFEAGNPPYVANGTNTWHLDGELDMRKILNIQISGKQDTRPYNGTEQTVEGFDYVATTNAPKEEKEKINVTLKEGCEAKAAGTNLGTYEKKLTAEMFEVENKDDYDKININITNDVSLKIISNAEQKEVLIKGKDEEITYDGEEHVYSTEQIGYEVEYPDDVPEGDISVTLNESGREKTVSGTNAGTYEIGLTKDDFNVSSEKYSNVTVKVEDGLLKINPIENGEVTVKGHTATVNYTGEEQYIVGYDVEDLPTGVQKEDIHLKEDRTAKAAGTDAGRYYMNLKPEDFQAESQNYKDITVNVEDGWLEITPIETDPAEDIYTLTIHYEYADGTTAAPTYTQRLLRGETFVQRSPIIEGYTPDYAFVRSDANGIRQNIEFTVVYTANAEPVTPDETTPDGTTPDGTTPGGTTPGGTTPDGTTPDGTTPDGTTPDGTTPDGTTPDGTTPVGTTPGGTAAGITTPVGTTPVGTAAGITTPVGIPAPTAVLAPAAVPNEEPVGAEISVDDEGNVEVTPVVDEEIPLANQDLDILKHCILHFLLLLMALLLYVAHIISMTQQKKRISELTDELDDELLKRGQGIE